MQFLRVSWDANHHNANEQFSKIIQRCYNKLVFQVGFSSVFSLFSFPFPFFFPFLCKLAKVRKKREFSILKKYLAIQKILSRYSSNFYNVSLPILFVLLHYLGGNKGIYIISCISAPLPLPLSSYPTPFWKV